MVITIDGPAGTGKSTVSQLVAERLGFDFLDTGAMYRAVALAVLRHNISLDDSAAIAELAHACHIGFDWNQRPPGVLLNGEPVAPLIRGTAATQAPRWLRRCLPFARRRARRSSGSRASTDNS